MIIMMVYIDQRLMSQKIKVNKQVMFFLIIKEVF